jgi:hypothetical protein
VWRQAESPQVGGEQRSNPLRAADWAVAMPAWEQAAGAQKVGGLRLKKIRSGPWQLTLKRCPWVRCSCNYLYACHPADGCAGLDSSIAIISVLVLYSRSALATAVVEGADPRSTRCLLLPPIAGRSPWTPSTQRCWRSWITSATALPAARRYCLCLGCLMLQTSTGWWLFMFFILFTKAWETYCGRAVDYHFPSFYDRHFLCTLPLVI